METRRFTVLNDSAFDLTPVLKAVKAKDKAVLQDFLGQGYKLSWRDHQTHKTLLFVLGEQFDTDAISFVIRECDLALYDLRDAVEGAAFANRSLSDLCKLDKLKSMYPHALKGAAKGGHRKLIEEILQKLKEFGRDYETMNIHFLVSGAAEANDMKTVNEFTSQYYRDRNNYLLISKMAGLARGGHTKEVEALLQKQHHWDRNAITDEGGYSCAYKTALRAAAETGNAALMAKIFLHLDEQERPMEHPGEVIMEIIGVAAACGHYDVVLDLLARIKLYNYKDSYCNFSNAMTAALRGAIRNGRYKLAVKLFASGAAVENAAVALQGVHDGPAAQFFIALENPALAYDIAWCHDNNEDTFYQRKLCEVMHDIYELPPVSKQAQKCYFDNKALNVWFRNHDKIHVQKTGNVTACNEGVALLVGEIVTEGKVSRKDLSEARYLARIFPPAKPFTKPELTHEQVVTNKIKNAILNELDAYLKSSMKYHARRAKALYSCVSKLECMESIYLLIKDQQHLLNSKPSTIKHDKATSALQELARTPSRTGHTYLHSLFKSHNSIDFLDRLNNCMQIIESHKDEASISGMLANHEIYDNPSFPMYSMFGD